MVNRLILTLNRCNCIYARAKDLNELVHLSLQESYCLPILTYASAVVKYTVRQEDELDACWNSVYRKLFGFNKWESVKGFICGLGRLDLHHIIKIGRASCRERVYSLVVY